MECQNTLLDDLSAEIGFTATCALSAMYGGKSLYIPRDADPNHPIAKLIGYSAFRILVKSTFGGSNIRFMPRNKAFMRFSRWRVVRDMVLDGKSADSIALVVGMTTNGVNHIRRTMEQNGILPMVLKGNDVDRP